MKSWNKVETKKKLCNNSEYEEFIERSFEKCFSQEGL